MAKVRLLDPTDSKRRLDRYELIGELASGGMATVYVGRIAGVGGFQRLVAIKRLHPHLAKEEEFIEMFLDEARLAASIHNPYVVPILEVGQSGSGYYLVMEYIEGDTLARIMARSLAMAKPIPRAVMVRILLDVLTGLHAAHELTDPQGNPVRLVHRDVSPQNILVGVDGCSRITDFGVAHAASRLSNTRADRLKGKLAYMSPEQARAGERLDRRADVFAMGIILWEVLSQKRLFKAEHEAITLQRVTVDPIPRLAQAAAGIHPAFDQVCAKALERDPARRYRSAAEMAEALERAARAAASKSPNDLGVASPREVAAYLQDVLGDDMAAQRESVRAWLVHSEPFQEGPSSGFKPHSDGVPSKPRTPPQDAGATKVTVVHAIEAMGVRLAPGPDVTLRMPLDRPPASTASPALPDSRRSIETIPDRSAARIATGLNAEPEPEMEPHEGMPDDDDDHETLLMNRSAAHQAIAALGVDPHAWKPAGSHRPLPDQAAASPSQRSPFAAVPPSRRKAPLIAVVVVVLLAITAVVTWWQLRARHKPASVSPGRPAREALYVECPSLVQPRSAALAFAKALWPVRS